VGVRLVGHLGARARGHAADAPTRAEPPGASPGHVVTQENAPAWERRGGAQPSRGRRHRCPPRRTTIRAAARPLTWRAFSKPR
jgi:hypothetical protein